MPFSGWKFSKSPGDSDCPPTWSASSLARSSCRKLSNPTQSIDIVNNQQSGVRGERKWGLIYSLSQKGEGREGLQGITHHA